MYLKLCQRILVMQWLDEGQEIILLNDSPTFKNYMQNAHVCKFAPLLIQ